MAGGPILPGGVAVSENGTMIRLPLSRVPLRNSGAILPEYTQRPQRHHLRPGRVICVTGLMLFGVVYGAIFALVMPYLIVPILVPLVIGLVLAIWVLPDARTVPTGALSTLLYAYLLSLAIWPVYLAIALPGTPWITVSRLIGAPLSLVLLYAASTSPQFRGTVARSLAAGRWIFIPVLAFLIIQIFSVALSKSVSDSLNKLINAQFGWTSIFFVSIFVFQSPIHRRRFAYMIWLAAVIMALVGLEEWREKRILWAGHIPSFLHVDDQVLVNYLRGSHRPYTDTYRAQSTASTSIGFAEFLALAAPFILYFLDRSEKIWLRLLTVGSLCLVFAGLYVADARSGLIGFCLSILSYGFAVGLRSWRNHRGSFVGIAISLSYPAVIASAVALSFMSHAVRVKVWGGGAQAGSTEARVVQMRMGLPLIAKNPLGYGVGQGASVLNYRLPGGQLTIDNYYLSLVLDYGVLGLTAFLTFIGLSTFVSGWMAFKPSPMTPERRFYLPIFQSLLAFFVIKSVFSQQDNHPVVFMIAGLLIALLAHDAMVQSPRTSPRSRART
jgi:hypothetical protein